MNQIHRPNLFIVGAPKCGTTAWVDYLETRPDVFFTKPKEPHYFNTDMPGFRWFRKEAEYLDLFSRAGDARIIGEASIMYLYSHEAAKNIKAFAPDAKILIFVRQHGQFIASYHQQLLYNRDENNRDLTQVWDMSGMREKDKMPPNCREARFLDYKSVGMFSEQIQRYYDQFPADQIKIIPFETWTGNPRTTYLELLNFLGLEDDGKMDFPKINAAHRHRVATIANMTQRPPILLSKILAGIRKFTGLENFRPGRWLRKINRAEGYQSRPDTIILNQIDAYYQHDRDELEPLLAAAQRGDH